MTNRDVLQRLAGANPVPDPAILAETNEVDPQFLLDQKHGSETNHQINIRPRATQLPRPRFLIGLAVAALIGAAGVAIGALSDLDAPQPAGTRPLEITHDGANCLYEGPTTLLPGDATFILANSSARAGWVDLGRITEDDKTLDDMYKLIAEDPTSTRPDWIEEVVWTGTMIPGSEITRHRTLEVGEYGFACGVFPHRITGSGGFLVVDE